MMVQPAAHINAATLLLAALTTAAGCHTAMLAAQLAGSPGLGPVSEYGLERYTGMLSQVAWLLALHTGALWLVLRALRGKAAAAVGPALQLQGIHLAVAILSLSFLLFMHGASAAWPLGFAVLGKLGLSRLPAGRAAHAAVWGYAALAAFLNNLLLQGHNLPFACASGLAPPPFAAVVTFRYTVLRFVSYAIDVLAGKVQTVAHPGRSAAGCSDDSCEEAASPRIKAVGARRPSSGRNSSAPHMASGAPGKPVSPSAMGRASSSWTAFLSYIFFAPLYLAGPVLTAGDYLQQVAGLAAAFTAGDAAMAKPGPPGQAGWVGPAVELGAWVGIVELSRRTFYAPEALLPRYASLWPWQVWFMVMCMLSALWLQSYVPWAFARLCAGALGIQTADEAPLSLLAASVSARTFWRSFHVSWHRWLLQYVYAPLGGGACGAAAVMLVSTLLHGFSWPWLVWGVVNFLMLTAERALESQSLFKRAPKHLRNGVHQTVAISSMVALLPLPSWRILAWTSALSLPMCCLNSVRMQRSGAAPGR